MVFTKRIIKKVGDFLLVIRVFIYVVAARIFWTLDNLGKKKKKVLVGNPAYFEMDGPIQRDSILYLIMDLPFGCNYHCLKCYRRCDVHIEDLDLDLRKRKISEAKEMGARVVGIAGEGEPLFHWEIVKELVRYSHSLGLITILYTNGSMLNDEKIRFLYSHGATLVISCDSFRPDVYKQLTGGGNAKHFMSNLEKARKIYSKAVKRRKDGIVETRLAIITIASKQNIDELDDMNRWCGDDIFFILNYPIKKGSAVKNWNSLVGDEMEALKSASQRFTDTGCAGLSAPVGGKECVTLYYGITIDTDGNVLVCPASVDTIVGNIKDASLSELRRRALEYLAEHGNPLCLARDKKRKVFKLHDDGGNIIR